MRESADLLKKVLANIHFGYRSVELENILKNPHISKDNLKYSLINLEILWYHLISYNYPPGDDLDMNEKWLKRLVKIEDSQLTDINFLTMRCVGNVLEITGRWQEPDWEMTLRPPVKIKECLFVCNIAYCPFFNCLMTARWLWFDCEITGNVFEMTVRWLLDDCEMTG